jgi:hypothetical protein
MAVAALAAGPAGCGDGSEPGSSGPLKWRQDPRLFAPETLPRDRILTGTLVNEGPVEVRIASEDIRLLESDGNEVEGSAIFLSGPGHGLYPPTRVPPSRQGEDELRRTGRLAAIPARGGTVPLTVSWRTTGKDGGNPDRIDYGDGSLPIPVPDL